jgi:hypothetical protein
MLKIVSLIMLLYEGELDATSVLERDGVKNVFGIEIMKRKLVDEQQQQQLTYICVNHKSLSFHFPCTKT